MKVTGSLQVKKGIYYAVLRVPTVDDKSKQKWRSTGIRADAKTKRERNTNLKAANKVMAEIILSFEQKTTKESDKLFTAWLDDWLEIKKKNVRNVTFELYELLARLHIRPFFEPLRLRIEDVTPRIIQRYINQAHDKGQSANSIKKHMVILSGVFKLALKFDTIPYNPCDRVELPKQQRHEGHAYTVEQVTQLLDAVRGHALEPAVMLALYLGLRRSEVLGLRWQDVDFESNTIRIRNTIVKVKTTVESEQTKSKASKRDFFLMPDLKAYLIGWRATQERMKEVYGAEYGDTDSRVVHVCTWLDGRPLATDYLSQAFPRLLKKNGLPRITFHELRHTCGSLLLESGCTIKEVQEYLGHERASTTLDIYTHLTNDKKISTGNRINNLLKR